MNLVPNMAPPDGEVIRTTVAYDKTTFNLQRANTQPFIGGPVDEKRHRILRKDILWSRIPGEGAGRLARTAVTSTPGVISVLNGIGKAGETPQHFYRQYRFAGLATGQAEVDAIRTDADTHIASDVQGLTWMRNGPLLMNAGDQAMIEVPPDTATAERLELARGPPEGGTPPNRYTAYVVPYDIKRVMDNIARDWDNYGRTGQRRLFTTPYVFQSLRRLVEMGAMMFYSRLDGIDADGPTMIAGIRNAVMQGANPNQQALNAFLVEVHNADYDGLMMALLRPGNGERVVAGANIAPDANLPTQIAHAIQIKGLSDLVQSVSQNVDDGGRGRVIGRAMNTCPPGGRLSILLYG